MSFPDAVRTCLQKYVDFSGRARRSEFWFFYLFEILAFVVAVIIDSVFGTSIFAPVVGLGLLLPMLAVAVRRLHDTGRSGWMILLGLIPLVGGIILLVFYVGDSQGAANQYGPYPKSASGPVMGYPAA